MEYDNRKIPYERRCEIGERLREFRLSKKMTQDEIAEILEISKTFYGQAERGNSSLGEYRLLLLADRLDADIGYILTGKKYYHVDILDKLLEIPEEKEKIIQQILKLIVEMP